MKSILITLLFSLMVLSMVGCDSGKTLSISGADDDCGCGHPVPVDPIDDEEEEEDEFTKACTAAGGVVRLATDEEIELELDFEGNVCSNNEGGLIDLDDF